MDDRLTTCPRCDYSLEGLPAAHACPECGLRYDEHSFVHVERRGRGVAVGFAVWISLFQLGKEVIRFQKGAGSFDWSALAIAVGVWALCGWYIVRTRRGALRIAVLPEGILLHAPPRRPQLVRWSLIDAVEAGGPGNRHVRIFGPELPRLTLMKRTWGGKQTDELARRIREAMTRYKSPGACGERFPDDRIGG